MDRICVRSRRPRAGPIAAKSSLPAPGHPSLYPSLNLCLEAVKETRIRTKIETRRSRQRLNLDALAAIPIGASLSLRVSPALCPTHCLTLLCSEHFLQTHEGRGVDGARTARRAGKPGCRLDPSEDGERPAVRPVPARLYLSHAHFQRGPGSIAESASLAGDFLVPYVVRVYPAAVLQHPAGLLHPFRQVSDFRVLLGQPSERDVGPLEIATGSSRRL